MTDEPTRRRPTLDEVAERAGVSRSAASRALNNGPNVSRAKREAVLRAIKELGYVPNPTARALATQQAGAVALIISGEDPAVLADPFYGQVIAGASTVLEETDLHLMLCLATSARGQVRVKQLLQARAVDGVMLMSLRGDDPLARLALEADVPVVFGGKPLHGQVPFYVDVDNAHGARQATDHLISLDRTRIATLTGPLDTDVGLARRRGYLEALTLAGLPWRAEEAGDFTERGGIAAMEALLARHPDLDAVFAANDNMAAGALRVLARAGRAVPAEVAVVGFDGLAISEITEPPLTTVHQPILNIGREMTRMLLALIAGERPSPLILPTTLVRRESA
ncbi:LacI family transcriptional regulator [Kitasatospora sp. MMS16-BH015]|uniref:LacI family DNA-binding transcriptional regulator n=1 Tax=Kitasatospora sp. MMS16-BH015 TaxID=2018025 RepID=UPI000CA236FF|nr:LacI family DNA-binding transcriptional regulator [Kitasatospora sp. MMS16-BH015]AUG75399.1 LacI family transcriptional regulator [Kitasatospora sp. MMS16-BH015]